VSLPRSAARPRHHPANKTVQKLGGLMLLFGTGGGSIARRQHGPSVAAPQFLDGLSAAHRGGKRRAGL